MPPVLIEHSSCPQRPFSPLIQTVAGMEAMVLSKSQQQHPGCIALMQLLNAGVWFLYPWLIMEMALPLHPEKTALQPLLLRVMVYLPCWARGTWLSSSGGLMALKSLRRSVNITAAEIFPPLHRIRRRASPFDCAKPDSTIL